mgnify:CR=1 FL=1
MTPPADRRFTKDTPDQPAIVDLVRRRIAVLITAFALPGALLILGSPAGPAPGAPRIAKLALVIVCLTRGFLDFIWALRQMNYTLALIGAAPEDERENTAFGEAAANLINPALSSFSQGVRGYYFALAAAAWLFGPLWLAAGVFSAFALLLWRQEASPAARAIRAARRLLE